MAEVGSEVWVRVNTPEAWVAGQIRERTDANITVVLVGGEETMTVPVVSERDSSELANVKLRNLDYSRFVTKGRGAVDDLIQLPYLHEPAILDVLHIRYGNDCIYTATGPILLAVNPFQKLPLYTKQILEEYYTSGLLRSQGVDMPPLPPHVFTVSDGAYRSMMDEGARRTVDNRNQSLLVSGESGAGKTETTKFIMQYLATVGRPKSGKFDMHSGTDLIATLPPVEKRVLDSNPILEAFGNAKTLRNENSSRFGKFICMQFNTFGELVGAKIDTYLLEKVRLVTQGSGERNYHVFYQMCAGGSEEERIRWATPHPSAFHFTKQSGCFTLREIDDHEEYGRMRAAMDTMGIAKEDQDGLFDALAGILHISNLGFKDSTGVAASLGTATAGKGAKSGASKPASAAATSDQCKFADDAAEAVANASKLLGVSEDGLLSALTSKEIVARTERYRTFFSLSQCCAAAEALAKAIYGKLFLYLVHAINRRIRAPSSKVASFIGVLDIFGFEHFETNSFEQLCINYANETLQQQFNQFVFKLEQAEYEREKINWSSISFPDNQDCLDLIEARKPPGLLALLDEQCMLASATDDQYANRLYKDFKENGRFSVSNKQKAAFQFVIRHYAGDVVYSSEGFIEKNRDAIHQEALELMGSSSSVMVQRFFNSALWETETAADTEAVSGAGAKSDTRPGKSGGLMSETVGKQFTGQLGTLVGVIRSTTPHYVRCIKPNSKQSPKLFERDNVVSQLRCGGVLEAVRVARLGYPVRNLHSVFLSTYRILVTRKDYATIRAEANGNTLVASKALLLKLADLVPPESIQIGLTKVFFRQDAFEQLEAKRQYVMSQAALLIQASIRGHQARLRFHKIQKLALKTQCYWRGYLARKLAASIRRTNAAVKIQAFARRSLDRLRYLRFRKALICVQNKKRVQAAKALHHQLRMQKAATNIQATFKAHRSRVLYVKQKEAAVRLQCWFRQRRAKALLDRYRREAREVGSLKANNEELRSHNKLLVVEVENLQAEVAALQERLAQSGAAPVGVSIDEEKSEEWQQRAALFEQKEQAARYRMAALEEELAQWKSALSTKTQGRVVDIASLRAFLAGVNEAAGEAPADSATKAHEPEARHSMPQIPEVIPLRARIAEMEMHLNETNNRNTALKKRLAEIEAEAEKSRALINMLMSAAAADKPSGVPGDAPGDGSSTETSHRQSMSLPVTASASTTAELNDIAAKRGAAADAVVQRDKQKISSLERKLGHAEKVAAEATQAKLRAEELCTQLRKENDEYKLRLQTVQKDSIAAYQKKLNDLTVHVANLEDANQKLNNDVQKRAHELHNLFEDKKAQELQLKARIAELTAEARDVKDEMDAMREKSALNMDAMMNVARRLETLVIERAELNEQLRLMKPKLLEAERERDRLRDTAAQLQTRLAETEKQRDIYQAQNKQLSLNMSTKVHSTPSPVVSRRNSLTSRPSDGASVESAAVGVASRAGDAHVPGPVGAKAPGASAGDNVHTGAGKGDAHSGKMSTTQRITSMFKGSTS